jgi:hypothetical protein
MRRRMKQTGLGLLLAGALAGAPAGAEQYLVNAAAGNNGDSHVDNDDPDAFAEFQRSEMGGGAEFYQASANASSGTIFASASHTDPLPPLTISTRAAAGIEETIHFDELPADSVTVRATLGVGVFASRNVGFANASARLDLGGCYVTKSHNAVSGPDGGTNCPGQAGADTIELVLTREQIMANNELDISVQISAQLEAFGGLDAEAHVGGGISLARGAGPVPGVVYLELDPPLAISFTGSQTSFPVPAPEPGAPLLLAAGAAALAAGGRRGRQR